MSGRTFSLVRADDRGTHYCLGLITDDEIHTVRADPEIGELIFQRYRSLGEAMVLIGHELRQFGALELYLWPPIVNEPDYPYCTESFVVNKPSLHDVGHQRNQPPTTTSSAADGTPNSASPPSPGMRSMLLDEVLSPTAAALIYLEHGWPVLPGTARSDTDAHDADHDQPPDSPLQPLIPCAYPITDTTAALQWWPRPDSETQDAAEPSVLLHLGSTIDALRVPRTVAEPAVRELLQRGRSGPVIYRPDTDTVYFLLRPGTCPELISTGLVDDGILLSPPDGWLPAPPTALSVGQARWWVGPESVRWRLAHGRDVIDALAGCAFKPGKHRLEPDHTPTEP